MRKQFIAVMLLLALTGCATASSTFVSDPQKFSKNQHVVQYYLPETVLDVRIKRTATTETAEGALKYDIITKQIADKDFPVIFHVNRNYLSTTESKIKVSSEGLLKSAEISGQGALSTALAKLGSNAAKTSEIRSTTEDKRLDARLNAISEFKGEESGPANAPAETESLGAGGINKSKSVVFSLGDLQANSLNSAHGPARRCTYGQIANQECIVSLSYALSASEIAANFMLPSNYESESSQKKSQEKLEQKLMQRCPGAYFQKVPVFGNGSVSKSLTSKRPTGNFYACVSEVHVRVVPMELASAKDRITSPADKPSFQGGCWFGLSPENCRQVILHRRFYPAELKVERCVQPLNEDLSKCNWVMTEAFEAPFAIRSEVYGVRFRPAWISSNALAANTVDGRIQVVNTNDLNAASEIVAAPFVIINSILSVPRAILNNEAAVTGAVASSE